MALVVALVSVSDPVQPVVADDRLVKQYSVYWHICSLVKKGDVPNVLGDRDTTGIISTRRSGVRVMKRTTFWSIFAATQLFGALSLATGSPHGNPLGLFAAMVLLFPGSILGLLALDRLGINFGYVSILLSAFPINIVCWYAFALARDKIRGKRSS